MIFEFLLLTEFQLKKRSAYFTGILILSLIPLFYAGITEIIQAVIITEREGAWFDFAADGAGIITGYLVYRLYRK
ncbi:hypothetical protein ES705_10870 [subsurface metagenome]